MPSRDRLRVALWLLVGVGLAYGLLLHWWWTAPMLALGDQIASVRDEELGLRMEAAQAPALRERLRQLQAQQSGQSGFLLEDSPQLAAASLVQRLESDVRAASPNPVACEIVARTPMDSTQPEPFRRVTVQVRLRCGSAELARVLEALETGTPQLFVENLDLRTMASYFNGGQSGDARIEVVFDLVGYLRAGVAAAGDGSAGDA